MIFSADLTVKFAALLDYRSLKIIPSDRIHPDDSKNNPKIINNLRNFKSTGPLTLAALKNTRIKFDKLIWELINICDFQLGFSKQNEDPWTGDPRPPLSGISWPDQNGQIFCFVA